MAAVRKGLADLARESASIPPALLVGAPFQAPDGRLYDAAFVIHGGRIRGAIPIPLGSLVERKGELSKDRPVVAVCRSGSRSAQATVLLKREGFEEVANLAGGMIRWRAEGLPVTTR